MSHNLSNRKTGTVIRMGANVEKTDAAMFYVAANGTEVPWHGLGVKVTQCQTSAEAIKLAGLDYEVAKGPIYTPDMKEIAGYSRTYRTDFPEATFGVVGTRYTLVQNSEGFEICDGILGGGALFDTAGALHDGRVAFINARLPESLKIAGDEVLPYFLFKNSHDGHGSIILCMTPIRVVCNNTLNMALGNEKTRKQDNRFRRIKHTRNYDERIQEAAKAMGFTMEYYTQFRKQAEELLKVKVSEKRFFAMMDELFGNPAKIESKRGATVSEQARTGAFAALNAPDLANINDTGWGVYNAIADYSDHKRTLRGENKTENAFLRTFEDTTIKDRALELILATK
jgi:phage/plasmid-like protein (TIGR03299 family)